MEYIRYEEPKVYEEDNPWGIIHIDEKKTKKFKEKMQNKRDIHLKAVEDCARFTKELS